MDIALGQPDSQDRISNTLRGFPPGETLRVKVLREGRVVELSGKMPAPKR